MAPELEDKRDYEARYFRERGVSRLYHLLPQ
jgi:hypothetical protein